VSEARPPADAIDEAETRFPGADPPAPYLREAFVAIAAGEGLSRAAAESLRALARIFRMDPAEVHDSCEAETFIELDLQNTAWQLDEAARECRRARTALRRTRSRTSRRRLRMVSGDA
jgi:hypothetical protein